MGIKVSSNFDQQAAIPLDSRSVVLTLNDRDNIPTSVRYEGMVVYVIDEHEPYILTEGTSNSNWSKLLSGVDAQSLNNKPADYYASKKYVNNLVKTPVPEDAVFTDTVITKLSELDNDISALTVLDIGTLVEGIDPDITRMGNVFNTADALLKLKDDGDLPTIKGINILEELELLGHKLNNTVKLNSHYTLDGGTY